MQENNFLTRNIRKKFQVGIVLGVSVTVTGKSKFCFQNSTPIFTFCPSVLCHSGHPQNFLAASLSIVICKDLDLGESWYMQVLFIHASIISNQTTTKICVGVLVTYRAVTRQLKRERSVKIAVILALLQNNQSSLESRLWIEVTLATDFDLHQVCGLLH